MAKSVKGRLPPVDLAVLKNTIKFTRLYHIYCYLYYFTEKVTGHKIDKKKFLKKKGFKPNLQSPVTFSEKLMWKKIHDRNPLMTITADKYKVRDYLKEILGEERAAEILIPLLFVTDKPDKIPFNKLPDKFIVKSNHASGWNMVVDKTVNRSDELIANGKKWLRSSYGLNKNEWAYLDIKPMIVIEELLIDETGNLPKPIKFYMFNGKCKYIRVANNIKNLPSSSYTPEWQYLPLKENGKTGPEVKKPDNLAKMSALAETLAVNFDFVRVDLYSINNKIYFSELTHYPNSAKVKIPYCYDLELGRHYTLIQKYWLNNSG
jgi:hypothetical protein